MAASTSNRGSTGHRRSARSVAGEADMSKPAPAPALAAWPSRSPANFSQLPLDSLTKMIQMPKAYYATHDTMPPSEQVITMQPTHALMKEHYQATDQKLNGKRNSAEQGVSSSPRPSKQPRAS